MPFTVEDSYGLAVPEQIAAPRRETAGLRRSGEQLRTEVAKLHRHVSSDLDRDDVLHAADRAAKLGTPVLPAVAGITITGRADAMARSRNVWQILDGHAIEPLADAPATP